MQLSRRFWGALLGAGLLVAGVATTAVLAQPPKQSPTPQVAQQEDQAQDPSYTGSITVPETQQEDQSEADEATSLQALAKISADDAKAAAVAANPGTTADKADLENENGVLVYAVTLSNGMEVKVDAGNAQILQSEQADQENEQVDQESEQADQGHEQADHGAAEQEDGPQSNEAPDTAGASSQLSE